MGFTGCIHGLKVGQTSFDLVWGRSGSVAHAQNVMECRPSPCVSRPCLNGGVCASGPQYHSSTFTSSSSSVTCTCPSLTQVWFLARSPHGMLLYGAQQPVHRGHFLSLNLAAGYMQFRLRVGPGVVNLTSIWLEDESCVCVSVCTCCVVVMKIHTSHWHLITDWLTSLQLLLSELL
ncbi:hypothetical protein Pcinc_021051 [Petrolisthes cinctipes]|uniref:Uncharacterized protein n=1 Tax=Petrolisthes cinctipes TaxID=88211 RepID=A0AAE1FH54_PETCI|nr:hypothetical protein Pcinc_021051 [Petrolisthes cinctipes]